MDRHRVDVRDVDGKAIHGARSSVRSGRVRITPDKVEGTHGKIELRTDYLVRLLRLTLYVISPITARVLLVET